MTELDLNNQRPWWPYALLFVLAYVAFANTFGNGWTYDDFPVIVQNPDVKSWAGFWADSYSGRPLRELTFLLDYILFGLEPAGWHIQQIFWHGLNACLVFALARRLQVSGWAVCIAALLFLLHPLQVEVVANISHRKDSLALAGSLGAILCYAHFLNEHKRRMLWLGSAVVFFVLALYAKQTAVMAPVVCLFYEMLLVPRPQRVLARYNSVVAGLSLVSAAMVVWLWQRAGGWAQLTEAMQLTIITKTNYLDPVTPLLYYQTVLKSWAFTALRLIWPFDLAPEYTFPVAKSLLDGWVLGGLSLVFGSLIVTFVGIRRWPIMSWLLMSAILLFLPTANLWPLTYLAADRYLYAPLAFLAVMVGYLLTQLPFPRQLLIALSTIVILLLSGLTWQQNQVWKSPETLWAQAAKVSPESSFALNNLGNLELMEGDFGKAEEYYRRSINANRYNPTAHYNLGMLAERKHDMKTSFRHYRAFARIKSPQYREALEMLRERLLQQYGYKL